MKQFITQTAYRLWKVATWSFVIGSLQITRAQTESERKASDVILSHLDGFTWYLVFGIEFSYSIEGVLDEWGEYYDVDNVWSYSYPELITADFIDWDSGTKTFSISDDVDPSSTENARVGIYKTDITLSNSRGKSKKYSFEYQIIDQDGDLWFSIIPSKEPDTIFIEPEKVFDYGPDPLIAITLMRERDARSKLETLNFEL